MRSVSEIRDFVKARVRVQPFGMSTVKKELNNVLRFIYEEENYMNEVKSCEAEEPKPTPETGALYVILAVGAVTSSNMRNYYATADEAKQKINELLKADKNARDGYYIAKIESKVKLAEPPIEEIKL